MSGGEEEGLCRDPAAEGEAALQAGGSPLVLSGAPLRLTHQPQEPVERSLQNIHR